VVRETPVEFRILLSGKDELGLALSVSETLPKRHGDLGSFLGPELEKLSERIRLPA